MAQSEAVSFQQRSVLGRALLEWHRVLTEIRLQRLSIKRYKLSIKEQT